MTATTTPPTPLTTAPPPTRSVAPSVARPGWRPGQPLLALLTGWVALFAWSGMVVRPSGFLMLSVLVGLVFVLVGSGLRALGVPAYAVGLVQLLIAMLSLNVIFAAGESLLGVVPTVASVRRVVFVIHNGAATLDHYSSPVGINPTHTRAMLTACALAVLLAIDVLAMGLRRPPLIALPLLITLSVPVSILRDAIALPVFVGTALLFLRLIASENLDRFRGWGSRGGQRGLFVARDQADRSRTPSNPALTVLWQVSLGAVLLSLLAAPLVPVTDLLNRDRGVGTNGGTGGGYQLTAVNPFIHLRRDLVEQTHTPLVYAQTQSRSTSYLRTTVLDEFTSDSWLPSPRNLPRNNDADGVFPSPPGLSPGVAGSVDAWSLELAPNFTTTWLPLPYPIRDLNVPGTWRYDSRTLDVAYVGGGAPSQLRYNTTAFTPTITAETLDASVRAPASVRDPMTKLPDNLPAVITAQAKTVTRGAKSDFAKALALQDWFRVGGGFRYSLDQLSGSGMDLLASFVTNDRVGYCEQFAAAMAAMGRTLGIPSRVVVGFLDGAVQADGRILYTSDDRHAWPEMYFSGVGWVRFEPTPSARAGVTPEWTRQSATTPLPSAAPSRRASQAPAAPRDQSTSTTSVSGGNRSSFPWWPVAALLAVLIVGLAPGLVRRVQRRRRLAGTDPVHLAEGAWAELRATALDLGLDWPELRSPREQARRVADQVHAKDADVVALEGLLVRVERGRYGRAGSAGEVSVDADARARTMQTVDLWRKAMVGSVDRQRGWRGRMWPVSLVPRRR